MKHKFLHKNNNTNLILFFNGWGMDESIVSHLNSEDFDVCIFQHYDSNFELDLEFGLYENIYLIAFSMGVWAAANALQKKSQKFDAKIAINGTMLPINDENGIPVSIFKGTIDHFSERNKHKFDRRMMDSKENFENFKRLKSERTLEDQLEELKLIYQEALASELDFSYDKAIIGEQDLIFPTKNQMYFWNNKAPIQTFDSAHFPFFKFKSWAEIVQL